MSKDEQQCLERMEQQRAQHLEIVQQLSKKISHLKVGSRRVPPRSSDAAFVRPRRSGRRGAAAPRVVTHGRGTGSSRQGKRFQEAMRKSKRSRSTPAHDGTHAANERNDEPERKRRRSGRRRVHKN